MGEEARCRAWFNGEETAGKALLESEELIFRGPARHVLSFADLTTVEAAAGRLTLGYGRDTAVFELGPVAEKWARKIQNPRTLVDKLDVKPGCRVLQLGVADPLFLQQLRQRTADVGEDPASSDADLVFVQVDHVEDLEILGRLERCIKRKGAIWVISPRGVKEMVDTVIMRVGREAGLVDVKVARFSATHTALKFVIPLARR